MLATSRSVLFVWHRLRLDNTYSEIANVFFFVCPICSFVLVAFRFSHTLKTERCNQVTREAARLDDLSDDHKGRATMCSVMAL